MHKKWSASSKAIRLRPRPIAKSMIWVSRSARLIRRKAEALSQQVTELEKKLGPEYIALVNDLNNVEARDAFLKKCMEDRGRSARPGACRSRQRAQAIEKPAANREQRIRI